MDKNNIIESGGFYFIHNFDSGNLGHVERVPTDQITNVVIKGNTVEIPDYEFNLWTRPDCAGTEFENQNRTWFYFGIQASEPNVLVKLNLLNLNKQTKMYNQGMAPVTRTLPGKPQWERIRDRPVHSSDENAFTLSFKYRTSDNVKATTFFAFTYPYSFAELQIALNSIDMRMLPILTPQTLDDIYYHRECLIYSLEGRRVDLLTISSHHGLTTEREERLQHLFPENKDRAFKFKNKKVIFMSARVHPGETPSSFVFNGFLNLLLNRHDQVAIQLRRIYVFKLIPFLNPDGVARGHYRTDTRGVNLNRVYLNPSLTYHPTIYAARALIRYYHFGFEMEDNCEDTKSYTSRSIQNISECSDNIMEPTKKPKKHTEKRDKDKSKNSKGTKQEDEQTDPFQALSTEAATLAEQVCDLKLQECETTSLVLRERDSKTTLCETSSLLNDNVLRSCLGSEVHVSTSEELNIQGPNPLRPLRDALKNSISLLMECNSVSGDSSLISPTIARPSNMRLGWCQECRLAVTTTDSPPTNPPTVTPNRDSISPKNAISPKRSLSPSKDQKRPKYHDSIEEYREHQRVEYEGMKRKAKDAKDKEAIHFCTNCFKKYKISEKEEKELETASSEQVRLISRQKDSVRRVGSGSGSSVAASAGDSGSSPAEQEVSQPGSTGDAYLTNSDSVQRQPRTRNPMGPKNITETLLTPNSASKEDRLSPQGSGRSLRRRGLSHSAKPTPLAPMPLPAPVYRESESGLFMYIDLHGHASKKGIFMYGNHFEDLESSVECMLLPRIMSLNNLHFHFSSCNFTERNMYLKDRRDGMSREGSGRVAVLKATGLVRSYTLECNYNTGRMVNVLPPKAQDTPGANLPPTSVPPKYTPHIYEEGKPRLRHTEVFEEMDAYEVGKSLASSILDLTGQHPNSRIPGSEHRTLASVRDWLRAHSRSMRPQLGMGTRFRPRLHSPNRAPLYPRPKPKAVEERKENLVSATRPQRLDSAPRRSAGSLAHPRPPRKAEPTRTSSRTKYLVEPEQPKPKSLNSKRRSVLALRKPNASKSQVSGVVKPKARAQEMPTKLSKRVVARRGGMSSSSSGSEGGNWGRPPALHLATTDPLKRRPFPPAPPAAQLKKIRLKTAT